MAFMTLEVILFRKKSKVLLNFALFFFFVYVLPSLINERPILSYRCLNAGVLKNAYSDLKTVRF